MAKWHKYRILEIPWIGDDLCTCECLNCDLERAYQVTKLTVQPIVNRIWILLVFVELQILGLLYLFLVEVG